MVLPGSHCRAVDREAIAHYGDIRGQVSLTVPAGTVVLTRYGIWHKAGPKNQRPRPQHDQVFPTIARLHHSETGSAMRRRFPPIAIAHACRM